MYFVHRVHSPTETGLKNAVAQERLTIYKNIRGRILKKP